MDILCKRHKPLEAHWFFGKGIRLLPLVSILAVASVWAGPLHEAAKSGDLDEVKQLVAAGGNVDERDVAERTPLSWAAEKGNLKVVQFLIDKGADVNARDLTNVTPLQHAVLSSDKNVVELLVESGADVNIKDDDGVTG